MPGVYRGLGSIASPGKAGTFQPPERPDDPLAENAA